MWSIRVGGNSCHRNFDNAQPQLWLDALAPFRERDLVVGCESTFNWYWLADLCQREQIPFLLGHAFYMKAIHGLKTKNDKIDSEKLAMLLRGGNFPLSYVYPRQMRATRDLLRRRTHLVRRRAQTLGHIQLVNMQYNLPAFQKKLSYRSNRQGVAERFEDSSARASIELDLQLLEHYDRLISELELYLQRHAKIHDPQTFYRLQSIPGVGLILAMTLMYEIHTIDRFGSVGEFLSYSRLVRGSHSSAGKRYAATGHKIGNPHLKCAFSEAVPLLKRQLPAAAAFATRIEKKHNKARANSRLAIKLGRAVYHMLRRKEAFDQRTFFH